MYGKDDIIERAVNMARKDVLAYSLLMHPNFVVGPHHRLICDLSMDLSAGKVKRQMLFMPPRSSKSLITSQIAPSWDLGHNPQWQSLVLSHSFELAQDYSREVRNMVNSDLFEAIFPGVELRQDSRAANRWHTNHGGIYIAAGVGSNIAGRGANIARLDDPLSEKTAMSRAERSKLNRWYTPGLRSRLMNNGRILLTNTRWHQDDLSGFLLKFAKENPDADQWEVLSIPAILDEETADLLNIARWKLIEQGLLDESYPTLEPGGTFWPRTTDDAATDTLLSGWKIEDLLKTKTSSPVHYWEALYMQRPSAEEGNIIRRSDWIDWEDEPPTCDYVLLSIDTSFGNNEESDFTAIQRWGVFYGNGGTANLILLGAKKGRWTYPELRKLVQTEYTTHLPDVLLIEKKASGQSLIQDLRLADLPVLEYQPDKDKIARAHACTPLFQAGRIWAPHGKLWAEEVINECASFPSADHDDHVDAATQAILWLRNGTWVTHPDDYQVPDSTPVKRRRFY